MEMSKEMSEIRYEAVGTKVWKVFTDENSTQMSVCVAECSTHDEASALAIKLALDDHYETRKLS